MNAIIHTTLLSMILAAAPPPTLVRVAIVDNSPSMAGLRITTVRNELTKVIRQLPPSAEYPLVLIVFHGQVEPTLVITDLPAAERAVAMLQGNGDGTHIAPALVKARDELLPYRAIANVLVMLYTDGEDGDQEGIRQAESQLDLLFSQRSRQGLSQSVFVKRWDNCNAELISRIRARGHVQVLDAGELNVEPMTVAPAVTATGTRRDPNDPQRLQVTYLPSVAIQGRRPAAALPPLRFLCTDTGAEGQKQVLVQPDTKPAPCLVTVPIPDAGKADHLTLTFQVTPAPPAAPQSDFVLPILPSSILAVPVTVPPLAVYSRLAAEVRQARAVEWQGTDALKVRCQVELAVSATAIEPAIDVDRATTFRIVARPGLTLVGNANTLQVPRPGTFPILVTLDVPLAPTDPKEPARTEPIELAVQPIAKPDYLSYEPPLVRVQQPGLAVPEQMTITITPVVRRIGPPVWIDLVEPLAAFDADVLFRVEGSIPQRTMLSLIAPGNIRGNLVPPGTTIHTGETTVTLKVIARLTPGKPERLDFSVVPPPPTAIVRFHVTRGFSLPVMAPPAATIVCVDPARPHATFAVKVADNQELTDVTIMPVLMGIRSPMPRRLPKVTVHTSGATLLADAVAARFFQPRVLRLQLPPASSLPFFFDSKNTVGVELRPYPATAAVLPGRAKIIVTRQAAFKRLLIYLAWALFPIGVLALLAKIIRRLREPVLP
jgi:hypothetical protein